MKKKKKVKIIEYKDLEFLVQKSQELLNKQISSYRQKHSNSGIIITVLALFIPFFLSGLADSHIITKYLSIVPIALLIWTIISFIKVLRTKSLDQGFHPDKFDSFVNTKYEDILLYEIGANRDSFVDNQKITEESNDKYNLGIKLTLIAIIISTCLLLVNNFIKPEKKPQEVIILNIKEMSKEEKPRVIPTVRPTDRVNLNEELNQPKPSSDKK
jgi:hypothetical protein